MKSFTDIFIRRPVLAVVVNLVMHEANARLASQWSRALAPELQARIIAPGDPFPIAHCAKLRLYLGSAR